MSVAELINKSDNDLFCKLCTPTHALNHLLPSIRNCVSLITRGQSYRLPEYSTDLHKKSFLIPCLYSFVKWNSFCTVRHSDFLCLLFDVRLSHLINITYIWALHAYFLLRSHIRLKRCIHSRGFHHSWQVTTLSGTMREKRRAQHQQLLGWRTVHLRIYR